MQLLKVIHRAKGLNLQGAAIERTAVRAVIWRGRELLMAYSANVGDYKFPGGGINAGETYEQALRREVQEECGMALARVEDEVGVIVEYNFAREPEYDVFKMTSHYYRCDVQDGMGM